MLKNSKIKKIGKYSILLLIKETYLLSKNIFGLTCHPFKTLNQILKEKDYSQAILIFTLPIYTFLSGLAFIISLRFLIQAPNQWGILAKTLVFLLSLLSLLLFTFLIYWLFKIKKIKNGSKRESKFIF